MVTFLESLSVRHAEVIECSPTFASLTEYLRYPYLPLPPLLAETHSLQFRLDPTLQSRQEAKKGPC